MSYISAGFLFTIALGALVYYLFPKKHRWLVLLLISLLYYTSYGFSNLVYVLFTCITSYIISLKMSEMEDKVHRKRLLSVVLVLNFGLLFLLKYCNFMIGNLNSLSEVFGRNLNIAKLTIKFPLGISFYTFQTMSYCIDVYRKKTEPERNIFKLLLFVCYLPQMLQGPIGRYERLGLALSEGSDFDYRNIERGAVRIFYGLAKKLILADRAFIFANNIFYTPDKYSGVYIIAGILMYSIYVYCDFAGGMDLVIGASEVFGITMDENFRQPYFSKNLGDFWRRWHITLGQWMKDYIFYPFSLSKACQKLSRRAKKRFGRVYGTLIPICLSNILIFFIVGVWHGASWKYIIYGLYNGLIIAMANILKPTFEKTVKLLRIKSNSAPYRVFQIVRTFILVNIGWFFDACSSASGAFKAMGQTFKNFSLKVVTDGNLLKVGLGVREIKILFVGVLVLFVIGVLREKGIDIREWIMKQPLPLKWAIYIILFFIVAPFGFVSASTEFVYAQF